MLLVDILPRHLAFLLKPPSQKKTLCEMMQFPPPSTMSPVTWPSVPIGCSLSYLGVPHAGVGLYPKGALINHSRDFNTVQSFDGAVIRFSAVQHLEAGEEITISYMDLKCSRPGAAIATCLRTYEVVSKSE